MGSKTKLDGSNYIFGGHISIICYENRYRKFSLYNNNNNNIISLCLSNKDFVCLQNSLSSVEYIYK